MQWNAAPYSWPILSLKFIPSLSSQVSTTVLSNTQTRSKIRTLCILLSSHGTLTFAIFQILPWLNSHASDFDTVVFPHTCSTYVFPPHLLVIFTLKITLESHSTTSYLNLIYSHIQQHLYSTAIGLLSQHSSPHLILSPLTILIYLITSGYSALNSPPLRTFNPISRIQLRAPTLTPWPSPGNSRSSRTLIRLLNFAYF